MNKSRLVNECLGCFNGMAVVTIQWGLGILRLGGGLAFQVGTNYRAQAEPSALSTFRV